MSFLSQMGSQGRTFRAIRHSASTLRAQFRKDSKSEELKDIRQQLGSSQAALETCLAMINL